MANPTTLTDNFPIVINATTTAAEVTLDPIRSYWVQHDGIDNTGSASTVNVYCTVLGNKLYGDSAGTPAATEGTLRFVLPNGGRLPLGPGVTKLKLLAASSSVTVSILPFVATMGLY